MMPVSYKKVNKIVSGLKLQIIDVSRVIMVYEYSCVCKCREKAR
eukprot:UN10010